MKDTEKNDFQDSQSSHHLEVVKIDSSSVRTRCAQTSQQKATPPHRPLPPTSATNKRSSVGRVSIMLVRVVSVAMAAAALLVAKGAACSIKAGSYAVMADMHDGDQKTVAVSASGDLLTITPYGNNQTWTTSAKLLDDCTAEVDFNVDGKPDPPPCLLQATLYELVGKTEVKAALGFTDKTGTITDDPTYPLNTWIQFEP